MAKLHILDISFPTLAKPPRVGTIRVIYHVNISTQKNPALDVSSQVAFSVPSTSGQIRGDANVRLGVSDIPALLSTHPDFGTGEATLLAGQDIAEVEVIARFTEGETSADVGVRLDSFYTAIQTKVQSEYTARFGYYGTERNPV